MVRHVKPPCYEAPWEPARKKGTCEIWVTFSNAAEVSCRARAGEALALRRLDVSPQSGFLRCRIGIWRVFGSSGRSFTTRKGTGQMEKATGTIILNRFQDGVILAGWRRMCIGNSVFRCVLPGDLCFSRFLFPGSNPVSATLF